MLSGVWVARQGRVVLSGTELDKMPHQEFIRCYHPKCLEAGQEQGGLADSGRRRPVSVLQATRPQLYSAPSPGLSGAGHSDLTVLRSQV